MRIQFKNIVPPLLIILLVLIVLEVLSTVLLPVIGPLKYRIPFNILIILYFGFKLDTPYLPVMIFMVQYVNSFFSVEGWATGTVAGVIICMAISFLRDIIHFYSAMMTILVTQIFQTVWFLIVSVLIYIRTDNIDYIVDKFWRFIPESIFISLIAPFFFAFFDRICKFPDSDMLSGDY